MAYYRLYCLRGAKTEVRSFEEFDAEADAGDCQPAERHCTTA